jgi:predicted nucleotide-binding protein
MAKADRTPNSLKLSGAPLIQGITMGERRQPGPQDRVEPSGLDSAIDAQMPRARVFIGSSSSGKEIARAIQAQLFDVADAEVWDEGVFGLSMGNLESLVQSLDIFDFAVLVLTPDDLVVSRGEERNTPRDNILWNLDSL